MRPLQVYFHGHFPWKILCNGNFRFRLLQTTLLGECLETLIEIEENRSKHFEIVRAVFWTLWTSCHESNFLDMWLKHADPSAFASQHLKVCWTSQLITRDGSCLLLSLIIDLSPTWHHYWHHCQPTSIWFQHCLSLRCINLSVCAQHRGKSLSDGMHCFYVRNLTKMGDGLTASNWSQWHTACVPTAKFILSDTSVSQHGIVYTRHP